MKKWIACCLLSVVCLTVAGCGYRLAGHGALRGADGDSTIAVLVFSNKSLRPNIEGYLAARLVDGFGAAGGGKVVPQEEADLVMSGVILSWASSASAYTGADRVAAYQASMAVEATLKQRKSGAIVWKGVIRAKQDYPVNADLSLQMNAEEAAIRELCRKLADDIIRKSGEAF